MLTSVSGHHIVSDPHNLDQDTMEASMTSNVTTDTAPGLRAWAKGMYPIEAAVELLIRTGFARDGLPWIEQVEGNFDPARDHWRAVDRDRLWSRGVEGPYSGGERRILSIAASLLGRESLTFTLEDAVSGLDRGNLALVLAAIAHANGSHEQRDHAALHAALSGDQPFSPGALRGDLLGPLFPWPA